MVLARTTVTTVRRSRYEACSLADSIANQHSCSIAFMARQPTTTDPIIADHKAAR